MRFFQGAIVLRLLHLLLLVEALFFVYGDAHFYWPSSKQNQTTTTQKPSLSSSSWNSSSNGKHNIVNSTTTASNNSQFRINSTNQRENNNINFSNPISTLNFNENERNNKSNNLNKQQSSINGSSSSSNFAERRMHDLRIPFWNLGHMVNSIQVVDEMIKNGVNGIETDITFDSVPNEWKQTANEDEHWIKASAYHGLPCDCFRLCSYREDFIDFIKYIKKVTIRPNNTLSVLILDLKLTTKELNETKKSFIGDFLAKTLMQNLYLNLADYGLNNSPIKTILSINHVVDQIVVRTFIERVKFEHLTDRMRFIGWDVGMNDKLENITQMWNELSPNKQLNVWQGDGLTNCANIVRNHERLREALSIRNLRGQFRKVYSWTVDVKPQIRAMLRLGIDGVLTNQPERIIEVLSEDEFASKYRLATTADDPFEQLVVDAMPWKMPNLHELGETVSGIRNVSSNYIHKLPHGIELALQNIG